MEWNSVCYLEIINLVQCMVQFKLHCKKQEHTKEFMDITYNIYVAMYKDQGEIGCVSEQGCIHKLTNQ